MCCSLAVAGVHIAGLALGKAESLGMNFYQAVGAVHPQNIALQVAVGDVARETIVVEFGDIQRAIEAGYALTPDFIAFSTRGIFVSVKERRYGDNGLSALVDAECDISKVSVVPEEFV